ncbi:MAG: TMEM175 family protein [Methanomicrobiales archaeon]|nr:TMEM175 family protein [Methanomicrobiales archaeon]
MTGEEGEQISGLTKGRVEGLTDGIFAFAMTLLVTTLDFPDSAGPLPPLALHLPDLLNYVIAFVVLAGFWIAHHVLFHHIRFIDRTLLWANVLSLLFVAVLPFSTDLVGDYSDLPLAAIFFEANLLAIGISLFLIWMYATAGRRLVDRSLSERIVRIQAERCLVIPLISGIGIFLALLGYTWTTLVYAATPALLLFIGRRN